MKKAIFILLVLTTLVPISAQAQKIGYVDTDYILNNIPEYRTAQRQLDDLADTWQKEMTQKRDSITKLKDAFNAEKILLSEEVKKTRQDEIDAKEKELRDFNKAKFGTDGEIFKKRAELIKPIQDKVYDAIQKVAKLRGLDIILDRASVTILFSKEKFNYSDDVLSEMGIIVSDGVTPDEEE